MIERESQRPREAIEAECDRRGRQAVVAGCVDLLGGGSVDPQLIYVLGGPPAQRILNGESAGPDYWLKVWALRGLMWVWDDAATNVVIDALSNDAWRVREMAAKVIRHNLVGDALSAVAECIDDPTLRVRAAAYRAVIHLTDNAA